MAETSKFIIYALVDPRDCSVFYVGRSSSGLRRPRVHWSADAMRRWGHLPISAVLREVLAAGMVPRILVLESFTAAAQLNAAEVRWIAAYRQTGAPLANLTAGGGGATGWVPPIEWRRKQSIAKAGRPCGPMPDEHKRQIAIGHAGKHHSEETKRRLSEIARLRPRGPLPVVTRARISAALKGREHGPVSEEVKRRISASVKMARARRRLMGCSGA